GYPQGHDVARVQTTDICIGHENVGQGADHRASRTRVVVALSFAPGDEAVDAAAQCLAGRALTNPGGVMNAPGAIRGNVAWQFENNMVRARQRGRPAVAEGIIRVE